MKLFYTFVLQLVPESKNGRRMIMGKSELLQSSIR